MKRPRGQCPACKQECALFGADDEAVISIHGPNKARCKGSGQRPFVACQQLDASTTARQPTASSRDRQSTPPENGTGRSVDPDDVFWPGATVRALPQQLVAAASDSLARALRVVCDDHESIDGWTGLLTWAKRRLLAPEGRIGRAALKSLLREQLTGEGAKRRDSRRKQKRPPGSDAAFARAVRLRIDAGDVRGAARVIANDGKLVEPDEDSWDKLKQKHPTGSNPTAPQQEPSAPLQLTLEQLLGGVKRMSAAGAPGADGLRAGHLKQLVGWHAGAARDRLQSALLDFANLCLAGAVPTAVRPLMFGARLVAFRKADGGVRPIAVGLVLRRLVAGVACAAVRDEAAALLSPVQVGVSVRGGAEAAVHAARRFLDTSTGSTGIVKLDFANAFNAVERAAVVAAVATHLPRLERFVRCAYGDKSILQFGDKRIESACGVQQGDPLGPLLFALTVRSISHSGAAELAVWYLDDATIGGSADQVVAEVDRVRRSAALIGLALNENKCEVVSSDLAFVDAVCRCLPGCKIVSPADCVLLGAAVGDGAVSSSLAKRAESLRGVTARLSLIDRHDALALLRVSLGHPRAVYELRAGASFRSPIALAEYDAALREAVTATLNVRLDDGSWRQCSLPPTLGGIGVRAPSDLALPAFLSSSAATQGLADIICGGRANRLLDVAIVDWSRRANASEPRGPSSATDSWQRPADEARHGQLVADFVAPRDVARLLSASTAESAALYRGFPCSRDGTRLSNAEMTIAVGLRLGLPVAASSLCVCGKQLDELGDHALSCNHGVERLRRHADVNARIRDSLGEAGFPAILEPLGLAARDSRRPDGVTIAAYERGRPMAWDATIIHTCAPSHLSATAVTAGAAAGQAEQRKSALYSDLGDQYDFRPVGIETIGAFGPQAKELAESLISRIRARTGDLGTRSRIYRRLAAAVQAGNARTVLEAHSNAQMGHFRPA